MVGGAGGLWLEELPLQEEVRRASEETRELLRRRLSVRPSVAELQARRILHFADYLEVSPRLTSLLTCDVS